VSKQLADAVIPNEYGIDPASKLRVGSAIAGEVRVGSAIAGEVRFGCRRRIHPLIAVCCVIECRFTQVVQG
jgi:hypothetical protein